MHTKELISGDYEYYDNITLVYPDNDDFMQKFNCIRISNLGYYIEKHNILVIYELDPLFHGKENQITVSIYSEYSNIYDSRIFDIDIDLIHSYRKLEKLLVDNTIDNNMRILDSLIWMCPSAHKLAYINCIETLQKINPDDNIKLGRNYLLSVELIKNHQLWFIITAKMFGYKIPSISEIDSSDLKINLGGMKGYMKPVNLSDIPTEISNFILNNTFPDILVEQMYKRLDEIQEAVKFLFQIPIINFNKVDNNQIEKYNKIELKNINNGIAISKIKAPEGDLFYVFDKREYSRLHIQVPSINKLEKIKNKIGKICEIPFALRSFNLGIDICKKYKFISDKETLVIDRESFIKTCLSKYQTNK